MKRRRFYIAVIGPSGTGKSTLLRCINLLETPTSGHILVNGEDITDRKCNINRLRTKLGMVFQSFNLYEHLTVVENCMLAQTVLMKTPRQQAYASRISEEKREKEYGKFWKEKKTVLRDFRWLAELSGRIEQLMASYSRDDNVVAFRRFLRWTNGDIPFSMFFTWHGLTQRVYFRCNYITSDVEDKELYDALCHMKPLKSEQYDGNWRRCL